MKYTVEIFLKAFEESLIKKGNQKILRIIQNENTQNLQNSSQYCLINLPSTKKLFTVIRSPHIDKKARDQFFLSRRKSLLKIEFVSSTQYSETTLARYVMTFLENLKQTKMLGLQVQIRVSAKSYGPFI